MTGRTVSADLMLYPDAQFPGHWSADFGGISVDLDTERRECKLFVSDDASAQDHADTLAVLSRFGIAHGHDAYRDNDVTVLVSYF